MTPSTNALDRLLGDELSRHLDRVAGAYRPGTLAVITTRHPGLRFRLDEAESSLGTLRAALLEQYGAWRAALRELEDLWALAELKGAEPQAAEGLKSAA